MNTQNPCSNPEPHEPGSLPCCEGIIFRHPTTPSQGDELDELLRPFKDAVESDESISDESDELVRKEWAKLKAAIQAQVDEAVLQREIQIHDDYWHWQGVVAKEGIGRIALRNRDAAKERLAALTTQSKAKETG